MQHVEELKSDWILRIYNRRGRVIYKALSLNVTEKMAKNQYEFEGKKLYPKLRHTILPMKETDSLVSLED